METEVIIEIIKVGVGVVVGLYGIYEAWKSRRHKRAFELSESTLEGIVAVIELLPENDKTQDLKEKIRRASTLIGTESEKLAGLVSEIRELYRECFSNEPNAHLGIEEAARAAKAVQRAREARRKKGGSLAKKVVKAPVALFLAVTVALSVGCAKPEPRLTAESVWPGEAADHVEIVVEWPEGVKSDSVETMEIEGRALSVAPYLAPATPEEE